MDTLQPPPLLSLPAELLAYIVMFAQNHNPDIATVFAAINKQTRAIALSTPNLWATIAFTPAWGLPRTYQFLALSGSALLDVAITYDEQLAFETTIRTDTFLFVLNSQRHRIGRLSACCVTAALFKKIQAWLLANPIPKLHSLDFGIRNPMEEIHDFGEANLGEIQGAGLRSFSTSALKMDCWKELIGSQLTFLMLKQLGEVKLSTFLDTLEECPNLESLVMDDVHLQELEDGEEDPEAIDLESLRSFALLRMKADDIAWFPAYIYASKLRSVRLSCFGNHCVDDDLDAINRFKNQFNWLEELDITGFEVNSTDWEAVLSCMPKLRILRFASCNLQNEIMIALSGSICGRLVSLTLDNEINLTSNTIRKMVQARIRNGRRALETLRCRGLIGENVDWDDVYALQDIVPNLSFEDISIHDYHSEAEEADEADEAQNPSTVKSGSGDDVEMAPPGNPPLETDVDAPDGMAEAAGDVDEGLGDQGGEGGGEEDGGEEDDDSASDWSKEYLKSSERDMGSSEDESDNSVEDDGSRLQFLS